VGVSFAWHDVLARPRSIGIRAAAGPGHRRAYTLIGILRSFVTGFEHFAAETDKTLLGFEINPLHNIVHLSIGLAGLAMWRQLDTARAYGWLLAAGYGLTFLYGLFAAGNSDSARRAPVRAPNRHDLRPVTTAGDRYDRHPPDDRPDRHTAVQPLDHRIRDPPIRLAEPAARRRLPGEPTRS